jgi:hypothetical protein
VRIPRPARLLGILLAGCATVPPPPPPAAPPDLAVMVVAARIKQEGEFNWAKEIPVCIGSGFDRSASELVLLSLSMTDKRIRGCAGTFEQPVYIRIQSFEQQEDGSLHIRGGYYCGPICANSMLFILHRQGEEWVIVKEEAIAIS